MCVGTITQTAAQTGTTGKVKGARAHGADRSSAEAEVEVEVLQFDAMLGARPLSQPQSCCEPDRCVPLGGAAKLPGGGPDTSRCRRLLPACANPRLPRVPLVACLSQSCPIRTFVPFPRPLRPNSRRSCHMQAVSWPC